MRQRIAIIGEHAPMKSFLKKQIRDEMNAKVQMFGSVKEWMSEDQTTNTLMISSKQFWKESLLIRSIKPTHNHPIKIIVWGESSLECNMKAVLQGADDFLTPTMLCSFLLSRYIKHKCQHSESTAPFQLN